MDLEIRRWQTKALCREIKACFCDLRDLKARLPRPVYKVVTLHHWTSRMGLLRPGRGAQDSVTREGSVSPLAETPPLKPQPLAELQLHRETLATPLSWRPQFPIWRFFCSPRLGKDARLAWVQLLHSDCAPAHPPRPKGFNANAPPWQPAQAMDGAGCASLMPREEVPSRLTSIINTTLRSHSIEQWLKLWALESDGLGSNRMSIIYYLLTLCKSSLVYQMGKTGPLWGSNKEALWAQDIAQAAHIRVATTQFSTFWPSCA